MPFTKQSYTCDNCGTEFNITRKYNFRKELTQGVHPHVCSDECHREYTVKLTKNYYKDGTDYVECKICGMRGDDLLSHINLVHKLSGPEYKEKYGVFRSKRYLKKQSDRVTGDKNPAYQHGGKFSPWSDKSIKHSSDQIKLSKEKAAKNRTVPTQLEYWLNQGLSEKEAKQKQSEIQSVFTLEKCIEKYGKEEGQKIWKNRQERWLKTLDSKSDEEKLEINRKKVWRGGFISKTEKELIDNLEKSLNTVLDKQFKIQCNPTKSFYYDMKLNNNIIEYNGDYWHANPNIYESGKIFQPQNKTSDEIWEKDRMKKSLAEENGYKIHTVWESDYKKDKNQVLQECLTFLTQ